MVYLFFPRWGQLLGEKNLTGAFPALNIYKAKFRVLDSFIRLHSS